jgi:hypothetical protein
MITVAGLAGLLLGCGGGVETTAPRLDDLPPPVWSAVAAETLSDAQQGQLNRAIAAKDAMAQSMMAELKAELELGGPSGAVVVCRDMAPMIAEHVADDHGLAIGRTSHRLRNPANVAPDWGREVVAAVVSTPTYLAGPEGELGVMLPIKLASPCLVCHGPREGLTEDVRTALAESYPEDRATGFSEGDLRGWFWIEVPAG